MKKILTLLIAIIMLFCLVGCSKEEIAPKGNDKNSLKEEILNMKEGDVFIESSKEEIAPKGNDKNSLKEEILNMKAGDVFIERSKPSNGLNGSSSYQSLSYWGSNLDRKYADLFNKNSTLEDMKKVLLDNVKKWTSYDEEVLLKDIKSSEDKDTLTVWWENIGTGDKVEIKIYKDTANVGIRIFGEALYNVRTEKQVYDFVPNVFEVIKNDFGFDVGAIEEFAEREALLDKEHGESSIRLELSSLKENGNYRIELTNKNDLQTQSKWRYIEFEYMFDLR